MKFDTSVLNTPIFALIFITLLFLSGTWLLFAFLIGVALVATFLLRSFLLNKRLPAPPNAAVLITGCSSGFGEDASLRLASQGVLVFAGVRRAEHGEKLQQKAAKFANKIVPVILDVTDQKQVTDSAETVKQVLEEKKSFLLGLINNAGYSESAPLEVLPLDKIRKQFEVNVTGQVAVTQAMLPLLRAPAVSVSAEGATGQGNKTQSRRIIFVSSGVGLVTFPGFGIYSASKHAVEAIGDTLRMELAPWGIDVSILEPGAIATEFSATNMATGAANVPKEVPPGMDAKVLAQYHRYIEATQQTPKKRGHVSVFSDAVESALFDSAPLTRYLVGSDVQLLPFVTKLPNRLLDLFLRGKYK